MNFDDAVKAHTAWKVKLFNYLKNPDKSLDHNIVCKDNVCDLGKWIYKVENKFSTNKNYLKLKSIHADFHKEAANIVQRIDNGEKINETDITGNNSKFNTLSNEIVSLLMQMQHLLI
ncbi:hypothetical protein GCL60_06710 [Silvanigrella paludirubra]|uniref:Chemoreceptor zinc-binding domain-containing protein n=1 Tax=Silvanigrella paludirubra TaxID=2499159 RepID=A0A6N6VWZ5_9BACT|nr:CZB domain-containing protein [Silvanigrella paludirubra]KAB8039947.1 hypothetical protein GCL60_06710 [Silvanigrella paludirubra]